MCGIGARGGRCQPRGAVGVSRLRERTIPRIAQHEKSAHLPKINPVIARPVRTYTSGGSWQSASPMRRRWNTHCIGRGTDSHVASLSATAAYHDSLICRLVPLGGMTEVFFILPCIFPNGTSYQLETPQALRGKWGTSSRF